MKSLGYHPPPGFTLQAGGVMCLFWDLSRHQPPPGFTLQAGGVMCLFWDLSRHWMSNRLQYRSFHQLPSSVFHSNHLNRRVVYDKLSEKDVNQFLQPQQLASCASKIQSESSNFYPRTGAQAFPTNIVHLLAIPDGQNLHQKLQALVYQISIYTPKEALIELSRAPITVGPLGCCELC